MKCPKCGTPISRHASFCSNCGTAIVFPKKKPKRILIYIISLLAFLIFAAVIFPTDENGEINAPLWYARIALFVPILIAVLYGRLNLIGRFKDVVRNQGLSMSKISNNIFAQDRASNFVVPRTKKKQTELAQKLINNIEICISLANESDCVSLFIKWYDEALEDISKLMQLKKVSFQGSPHLDYRRITDEFQWHLCDAIVRAKETAISEIKEKYRNSREFQERAFESFQEDINCVRSRFSPGTSSLADESIREVASIAGIREDIFGNSSLESAYNTSALDGIDYMDGHQFEYWCADLLRKIGFNDVEVTRGSGDQGVDILAKKDGVKYAVQCKNYSSDLGNTPIQEVNTGRIIYHCQVGAVMTNRYFTKGAKDAAEATDVLLWDRDWIRNKLSELNK